MKDFWKENAIIVDLFSEGDSIRSVDYQKGYYICPDCKSKVYKNKSYNMELESRICPFCKEI